MQLAYNVSPENYFYMISNTPRNIYFALTDLYKKSKCNLNWKNIGEAPIYDILKYASAHYFTQGKFEAHIILNDNFHISQNSYK